LHTSQFNARIVANLAVTDVMNEAKYALLVRKLIPSS
jgi:hypothetical protein